MKPSIEQALGFRGIEFLEKLFGDGFGMECGLNGPKTLIAKAFITASWTRQNTRARGAVHKIANARQAKDDAAKAVKHSANATPKEKVRLIKEWSKALSAYRKVFEWMTTAKQYEDLLEEQEEIRGLIESANISKGESIVNTLMARLF